MTRLPAILLACTLTGVAAQQAADPVLLDRILAVVNEDVVMLSELRNESRKVASRLRQRGASPMPDAVAIQKQAFENLILNKLQLAEAARLGIEADEETLDRAVAAIASSNQMSVAELREALKAEGMNFDTFRASMRDEIIVRRLRNREVTNRIQVTKSEIDGYLERTGGGGRSAVDLSFILLAAPANDTAKREQARQLAAAIVARLRAGEPFAPLAQQYSADQSGQRGGQLGWIEIGRIPPELRPYVNEMGKGDIAGPVALAEGFSIIQLNDLRLGSANIVRQTRARHILIRTNEVTSDEEAQRRLGQLRQRAIGGDDFGTLARSNSDDTASAINGGDLGWSTPGNLVPAFEEQMDLLADNDISPPFKTQFGWHIVQVLGRRDYDATEDSRRDQARKAVRDEKADEALDNFLRRLRDEAYIELRLDDGQG